MVAKTPSKGGVFYFAADVFKNKMAHKEIGAHTFLQIVAHRLRFCIIAAIFILMLCTYGGTGLAGGGTDAEIYTASTLPTLIS